MAYREMIIDDLDSFAIEQSTGLNPMYRYKATDTGDSYSVNQSGIPTKALFATKEEGGVANAGITEAFSNLKVISTNTNWVDYSDPDFNTISGWQFTNGGWTIDGIVAPSKEYTRYLINVSSSSITIRHNRVSATVGNRFFCPDDKNFVLSKNGTIQIIYLTSVSAWFIVGV